MGKIKKILKKLNSSTRMKSQAFLLLTAFFLLNLSSAEWVIFRTFSDDECNDYIGNGIALEVGECMPSLESAKRTDGKRYEFFDVDDCDGEPSSEYSSHNIKDCFAASNYVWMKMAAEGLEDPYNDEFPIAMSTFMQDDCEGDMIMD